MRLPLFEKLKTSIILYNDENFIDKLVLLELIFNKKYTINKNIDRDELLDSKLNDISMIIRLLNYENTIDLETKTKFTSIIKRFISQYSMYSDIKFRDFYYKPIPPKASSKKVGKISFLPAIDRVFLKKYLKYKKKYNMMKNNIMMKNIDK